MTLLKKTLIGLMAVLAPLALAADEPRPPHAPQPRNPQMRKGAEGGPAAELRQGQGPHKPRRSAMRQGEPGLDLSEEQEKKLEAGQAEREKKEAAALKKVEEAREALAALLGEARNDSGHLGKLRSAHGDLKDAERELEDLRFEARLELRGVLDQDQVKKIGERHAKRKAARANRPKDERKERGPLNRPGQP